MSPGCWPTSTVLLCLLKYMTLHVSTREPAHAPASLSTQGFPRLCPGDLAGCVPPVRRQLSVPSRSQGAQGHRQEHNTTSTKQKPARDQHKRGRAPPRSELNCLRCRPSGAREEEGTGEPNLPVQKTGVHTITQGPDCTHRKPCLAWGLSAPPGPMVMEGGSTERKSGLPPHQDAF